MTIQLPLVISTCFCLATPQKTKKGCAKNATWIFICSKVAEISSLPPNLDTLLVFSVFELSLRDPTSCSFHDKFTMECLSRHSFFLSFFYHFCQNRLYLRNTIEKLLVRLDHKVFILKDILSVISIRNRSYIEIILWRFVR